MHLLSDGLVPVAKLFLERCVLERRLNLASQTRADAAQTSCHRSRAACRVCSRPRRRITPSAAAYNTLCRRIAHSLNSSRLRPGSRAAWVGAEKGDRHTRNGSEGGDTFGMPSMARTSSSNRHFFLARPAMRPRAMTFYDDV